MQLDLVHLSCRQDWLTPGHGGIEGVTVQAIVEEASCKSSPAGNRAVGHYCCAAAAAAAAAVAAAAAAGTIAVAAAAVLAMFNASSAFSSHTSGSSPLWYATLLVLMVITPVSPLVDTPLPFAPGCSRLRLQYHK